MTESAQNEPDHVVRCGSVREVIERYSQMTGLCALTVCVDAENTAVLQLDATVDGVAVTVVADASWLATLWRMRPGDRRPTRITALTTALEAHARLEQRTSAITVTRNSESVPVHSIPVVDVSLDACPVKP